MNPEEERRRYQLYPRPSYYYQDVMRAKAALPAAKFSADSSRESLAFFIYTYRLHVNTKTGGPSNRRVRTSTRTCSRSSGATAWTVNPLCVLLHTRCVCPCSQYPKASASDVVLERKTEAPQSSGAVVSGGPRAKSAVKLTLSDDDRPLAIDWHDGAGPVTWHAGTTDVELAASAASHAGVTADAVAVSGEPHPWPLRCAHFALACAGSRLGLRWRQ
jgi:hypothetical protein